MKALIIQFILSLSFISIYAQTGIVRGVIKDKNTQESIVGANVIIQGTTKGTITDVDGNYKLETPVGSLTLVYSFIGYKSEIRYDVIVSSGNAQIINMELEEEGKVLNEVVVSFDKNKSAAAADMVTPLSTQKLTTQEIKSNPGGNFDVSRVIQVLPGVGGGMSNNRNDIIVRGGAPNENVYFLDGIEIPVLNHFQTQGASGGATGILNVSFIEDVQLSTSAFDARYDNALASVFNIRQRNGNPEEFNGNIRLSGTEFATTLEGPLSKKTSFMVSARRSYLQLLFMALDLPIRPEYWDFQYKITHELSKKTSLNLISVGAIDKFRLAIPKNATPETDYISRSNPAIDQWNYMFGASIKHLINKGFYTFSLSRNMYDNAANQYQDNIEKEENTIFALHSQEIENKARIDVNKFVNGWKYSYGVMAQYVKYNTDIFTVIKREQLDSNGAVVIPQIDFSVASAIDFSKFGAFAQVSKRFYNNRLLLSSGIRSDINTFTMDGLNPLKTLSPRFSVLYSLVGDLDITGSIGTYYKIPVYTNLGYRNSNMELVNKDMTYIQSNHYVLGFQYLPKDDLRFTLEGFYKTYSGYPVSIATGLSIANQGNEFTAVGNEDMISVGEGKTYGVEFFIQKKLIKKTFYAFSTTLYKSLFSGLDGKLLPSSWDFGYMVSTTLGQKFGKGWEIGAKFRMSGGQPYTPFDETTSRLYYLTKGVGTLDYDHINSKRLSAFNQFDFRIDKKINFKKSSLDLYFDAQNLLALTLPSNPRYTFKRKADNSDFETTDGLPIKVDGSNTIPVLLEDNSSIVIPTIGFIFEF